MRRSTRQQRMGQGGDVLEREAVRAVWGPQTLVWADSDLMGTSRKAPATQSCCGRSLSPPPPKAGSPNPLWHPGPAGVTRYSLQEAGRPMPLPPVHPTSLAVLGSPPIYHILTSGATRHEIQGKEEDRA